MTVPMDTAMSEANPLMASHQSSDGMQVLLHPLVLLSISDLITRHTLRQQQGPIVGAMLGQQRGREVSLEHAFDCRLRTNEAGDTVIDQSWFDDRLQQFKDVFKAPPLELVGWFTVAPVAGPQPVHVPLHRQLLENYNESAVFLAFHPSLAKDETTTGVRLPLSIYESVFEGESSEQASAADGAEAEAGQMHLRFRELPFAIETGEAEMIGVDFVARGAGNAAVLDGSERSMWMRPGGDVVGSSNVVNVELSDEDEELITAIAARANAIKVLHSRIQLFKAYLARLPASYLTSGLAKDVGAGGPAAIDHGILRSLQAMVQRLGLVVPTDEASFERERRVERSDVSLTSLLALVNISLYEARELGRRYHMLESHRQIKRGPQTGLEPTADEMLFASFGGLR